MRRDSVAVPVLAMVALAIAACNDGQPRSMASQSSTPTAPGQPSANQTHRSASTNPYNLPTVAADVTGWKLPEPVAREVVDRMDASAIVAGGLVAGDQSTSRSYRLNPQQGTVTPLPDLPVAVHDAAGLSLHGSPLVVGGGNATEQATVQALGTQGWREVGRLPTPRADLVAVGLRRVAIVLGGYDGVQSLAAILSSPDGREFHSIGRLPVPVRYPAAVASHGVVWLLGGEHHGQMIDAVQRIDARTGRARVVGHLPRPLGHAAVVALGGSILLAGGRTGPDAMTAAMWWFDPATVTCRRAGRLPYPLADAGVFRTGRTAYLIGGETPHLSDGVISITAH
ncbi:MAG: kelch repeat-containing protein [Nocardioidaceae bacterium]